MATLILDPENPEKYLHAAELICRNRDKDNKHMHIVIDKRYVDDDSISDMRFETRRVPFDPDNPRHVTCHEVLEELALTALTEKKNELQSKRDERKNKST